MVDVHFSNFLSYEKVIKQFYVEEKVKILTVEFLQRKEVHYK